MAVEVFRTNVGGVRQASVVMAVIAGQFPSLRVNFDLSDCDRILRVEGLHVQPEHIIEIVKERGFECQALE